MDFWGVFHIRGLVKKALPNGYFWLPIWLTYAKREDSMLPTVYEF